jgi:hypothetical protein
MNIALVSDVVASLSVRLVGRNYAAWFSTTAIAAYMLFISAGEAVVRAAAPGKMFHAGAWKRENLVTL